MNIATLRAFNLFNYLPLFWYLLDHVHKFLASFREIMDNRIITPEKNKIINI